LERVDEAQFLLVMGRLRDLRLWTLRNRINPWATRQALIIALQIDAYAALHRGVSRQDLAKFDVKVVSDAQEWIRRQRLADHDIDPKVRT